MAAVQQKWTDLGFLQGYRLYNDIVECLSSRKQIVVRLDSNAAAVSNDSLAKILPDRWGDPEVLLVAALQLSTANRKRMCPQIVLWRKGESYGSCTRATLTTSNFRNISEALDLEPPKGIAIWRNSKRKHCVSNEKVATKKKLVVRKTASKLTFSKERKLLVNIVNGLQISDELKGLINKEVSRSIAQQDH